ncbi:hypothetical protein K3495_g16550, partial [Podosphaera aphanis]
MQIPDGYKLPGKCYLLRKSIYGLKQSPLVWYSTLSAVLEKDGFVAANFDPCVFINLKTETYLAIYVDDILMFGSNNKNLDNIQNTLQSKFECTNLGNVHYILGIQIEIKEQYLSLGQQSYVLKILERFGMVDCHSVGTPLDPGTQLQKGKPEEQLDDPTVYQSIIGSLMYACVATRPDLAHAVTLLSQFSSCPNNSHLAAAKRVLRYLKGTADWKLYYPRTNDLILHGFTDSSYGNFYDDRKSCSGYVFRLGEA